MTHARDAVSIDGRGFLVGGPGGPRCRPLSTRHNNNNNKAAGLRETLPPSSISEPLINTFVVVGNVERGNFLPAAAAAAVSL